MKDRGFAGNPGHFKSIDTYIIKKKWLYLVLNGHINLLTIEMYVSFWPVWAADSS